MVWRAYGAEHCFHSEFTSRIEYLLIFGRGKICCGIKDQADAVTTENNPG